MTLAFGEACLAAQNNPAPDVRTYTKKPTKASQEVPRTLFAMLDGASANCCKADTVDVKGKNGEAGTRQVRVGVLGEYGWLDEEGHPVPWRESMSYIVSGECIAEVTGLTKKHGIARGSGTVPRMQCLADGEEALEIGLRDAFPHAEFTNDFYHASDHTHALCMNLGLGKDEAQKKYRFLRGLLYRIGADRVVHGAGRMRLVRRLLRRTESRISWERGEVLLGRRAMRVEKYIRSPPLADWGSLFGTSMTTRSPLNLSYPLRWKW